MPQQESAWKRDDLLLRLAAAVCGAHIMVVFGVETTFFEAILNPVYYRAMAGSILIALPVVEYTGFISRRLDKRYNWVDQPLQRLLLQVLFGVLITCTLVFLLASLYFYVRGVNIFNTLYLRLDFPLVVCLVLMMNLLFVLQYFYRHVKSLGRAAKRATDTAPARTFENLIVRAGNQTLSLALEEVAFFYLEDSNRYVQTLQGRKLMITESLEELEAKLAPTDFFRANRQVIVSRKACTGFTSIEFGKLELVCYPAFGGGIIVGQRKAREFRQWFAATTATAAVS